MVSTVNYGHLIMLYSLYFSLLTASLRNPVKARNSSLVIPQRVQGPIFRMAASIEALCMHIC